MSGLKKNPRGFHDNSFFRFIYFCFCVSNLFVGHLQGFPFRRVPQLTPGASGSAVGFQIISDIIVMKGSDLDLPEKCFSPSPPAAAFLR